MFRRTTLALFSTAIFLCNSVPLYAQTVWWKSERDAADVLSDQGRYEEAIKKREAIVQKLEQNDTKNLELVTPLVDLAREYNFLFRRSDAERIAKRALAIAEIKPAHTATLKAQGYTEAQLPQTQNMLRINALLQLSDLYRQESRDVEAERFIKMGLASKTDEEQTAIFQSFMADVYAQRKQYKEAAELYKKVIAARERLKDPAQLAEAYRELGDFYKDSRELQLAENNLVKAIEILKTAKLEKSSSNCHTSLGGVYQKQKKFPQAEQEFRAALQIDSSNDVSAYGIAPTLRSLGETLVSMKRAADAEPYFRKALKSSYEWTTVTNVFVQTTFEAQRKAAKGLYQKYFNRMSDMHQCITDTQQNIDPNSVAYAKFLEDLVVAFPSFSNQNENMIALVEKAISIRERLEGPCSPQIAHDKYLLAYLLASLGADYSAPARSSYNDWKQMSEKHDPRLKSWQFAQIRLAYLLAGLETEEGRDRSTEVANLAFDGENKNIFEMRDLGKLFELLGHFGKARLIYDDASTLAKAQNNTNALGELLVAKAGLNFKQRDTETAWEEAKQAEELFKQSEGPEYFKNGKTQLSCVQLLAELSVQRNDLLGAETYARLLVSPLHWKPNVTEIQQHYLELAKILFLQNRMQEAKKIAELAVHVLSNQTRGTYVGEIELANAHDLLGKIEMHDHNLDAAEMQFRQAWNFHQTQDKSTTGILGAVDDLNLIARCQSGSSSSSTSNVLTACKSLDKYMKTAFPQLSFAEQCAFITCIGNQIDPLLTYAIGNESASESFQYLIRWQGLLIDSVRRARDVIASDAESIKEIQQIRKQLSQISSGSKQSLSAKDLTAKKEAIERRLAVTRKADTATDAALDRTARDLANSLAVDEAFVDLVHFQNFDNGTPTYVAFVCTKSGGTKEVRFSDAAQLDTAVSNWVQAMANPSGKVRDLSLDAPRASSANTVSLDSLSSGVSDKIWNPIKAALPSTVKKLWLCPDARLSTLPWSVLLENAHENVILSQVDSPRAFLNLNRRASKTGDSDVQKDVLLVGGIKFENKDLYLPGTEQEVVEIAKEAQNKGFHLTQLTGSDATKESVLQNLSKATFAHIATHGFFNQSSKSNSTAPSIANAGLSRAIRSTGVIDSANAVLMERDPLLSSGILVAPTINKQMSGTANNGDTDADDHLTAEELVGQNLSRCSTVVLSACNTGRGKGYDGQGVMGLRAALVGAGVQGVVMSLWPVDDDATRELMKQFYLNLWNKTTPMPPALALRTAQQSVRNNPNGLWKHPFYWAGWIYDGVGW
ncbi:MAG: CHAT domain-containing protein [Cyanobacteria bacterium SZAS-4]|nr:CHAT domain-containing protein [Cyanobacteria bacterium SZAS-4]